MWVGREPAPGLVTVADPLRLRARRVRLLLLGHLQEHFRILTRQGSHAPGGAYSYVINGRMIAGFAMIAYPAEYGQSGVMTFIVSHNGKVYEKDLGKHSTALAARIATFDPGAGWEEVAP